RVEALRENPRVCLTVSHYDQSSGDWESVILWGDAEFVEDPRTSQEIITAFFEKYRNVLGSPLNPAQQLPKEGVEIRIPVDIAAGRSSGSIFSVRSRPGRLRGDGQLPASPTTGTTRDPRGWTGRRR